MKIYVYTRAYSTPRDWLVIAKTEVFKTFEEATECMAKDIDSHLNDPEDDWILDYKLDNSAHLSCFIGENCDEAVMEITEHEI